MSQDLSPTPGRPSSSLHFVVGEMNGKLDQLLTSILPQLNALRLVDEALDSRIYAVELRMSQFMGGGMVIIFLIGAWEFFRYVIQPTIN
jgi:hypothetical protein